MAPLNDRTAVVVDVWLLAPRAVAAADLAMLPDTLLDDVERTRAAALPGPAAGRFVLGRALLRSVLAQRFDCAADGVPLRASCPTCGGPHGPVTVVCPREPVRVAGPAPTAAGEAEAADTHVSITRSGPVVAVAVCQDGPVGIDVEALASVGASPLADVVLSRAELARHRRWPDAVATRRLARAWVRKEAALKAMGTGLAVAPETVQLRRPPRGTRGVDAVAGTTVAVADLPVARASAGAVAVVAPALAAGPGPTPTGEHLALVVRTYDGVPLLAGRRS